MTCLRLCRRMSPPSMHSMTVRFALAAIAAVSLAVPTSASAQLLGGVVFDPTNFARNVLHYTRRLEQIDMQRQQLEQQITSLKKLPNPPWRDISQTMGRLNAVMADGRALAYQLANLDEQFRRTFPVDRAFQDWPTERRTQAARTVATMGAALANARAQAQVFGDGVGRLNQMKAQVGTVQGHEGALELQNAATVFGAEELVLLRQALMAQTSMQAVYYADRVNTEARQAATIDARLSALTAPARRSAPVSMRVKP